MTGGGTKRAKLPPKEDPIPTPEEISLEAQRKGQDTRMKLKARAGRAGTILTIPGSLGEPLLGKSTILGRTT